MLFYVPLESYPERYTCQLSAPRTGWFERNWIKHNIPYHRVEPYAGTAVSHSNLPQAISTGVVLDAQRRAAQSFGQVENLLYLIQSGKLTSQDVIYLDDFWTPGIEMVPYTCQLMGMECPRIYAYCWAQSVDEYDFTHAMAKWIRYFEEGLGEIYSGVFVANSLLKTFLAPIIDKQKIHVVGLPFDSEEVIWRIRDYEAAMKIEDHEKKNLVVFTSRWDKEKNPMFFLNVVQTVLSWRRDIMFRVCTGQPTLRSNHPGFVEAAYELNHLYPGHFQISAGLTKNQYYQQLRQAKVQFNCADQDWTSFTLLEASVAGCYPIYPNFRSFPETFDDQSQFMYERGNVEAAARMICSVIANSGLWEPEMIEGRAWIHRRYDSTWKRILYHTSQGEMFKDDPEALTYYPHSRHQ